MTISTGRPRLRPWRDDDLAPFAALNADPRVMEHFPKALAHAFGPLGLSEIVSFTVPANRRSRSVMERLGMRRSPDDDFEHPLVPQGHKLRPHVLYRLSRIDWAGAGPRPLHSIRSFTGVGR